VNLKEEFRVNLEISPLVGSHEVRNIRLEFLFCCKADITFQRAAHQWRNWKNRWI